MTTVCKIKKTDIAVDYNGYFTALWAKDYPDPGMPGGPNVNWFDGAIAAIEKTFASYTLIITALHPAGGITVPPAPPQVDPNTKDLPQALRQALLPQSAWITKMAHVTEAMSQVFGECASKYAGAYTNAYLMIESLQNDLATSLALIDGAKDKDVCDRALQWIRTFFYWQETFSMWEQVIADHCLRASGTPPSPSGSVRVELSNPIGQALITVIQLPADLGRGTSSGTARQIPPPKWPPWS